MGTQVCEEGGTADCCGYPPVREMDGWEFSFTCALPLQSLALGNALSPFSAGPLNLCLLVFPPLGNPLLLPVAWT